MRTPFLLAAICLAVMTIATSVSAANSDLSSNVIALNNNISDYLKLPAGFKASVYYTGSESVVGARSIALSGNSTLSRVIVYVSSRKGGTVSALVDNDGDGVADSHTVLMDQLFNPNGIAWREGSLYVSGFSVSPNDPNLITRGTIHRYDNVDDYALNGTAITAPPVLVTDALPNNTYLGSRYLRFGPDGRLYCTMAVPCNICIPPPSNITGNGAAANVPTAAILAMNPDGSNITAVATGIRNTVGFDWHPDTGRMYFTMNERDGLAEDGPDDGLLSLSQEGDFFGFPYCHPMGTGPAHQRDVGPGIVSGLPDPDVNPNGAVMNCNEASAWRRPVQALGPHVAPLGVRFYVRNASAQYAFPPQYDRALLIAQRGSSNRNFLIGYRVMMVQLNGSGDSVAHTPFLSGFIQNELMPGNFSWGRPVDVEQLPDGSILVSDDTAADGTVYRVAYTANPPASSPPPPHNGAEGRVATAFGGLRLLGSALLAALLLAAVLE